jgi:hypothetical protein
LRRGYTGRGAVCRTMKKKRVLRWSIIWAIAFLVLALVPVVPLRKGKGGPMIGRLPLLFCYMEKPTRNLPLLWPYVLGHVGVTTLIVAQFAARRAKTPAPDSRGKQAG